MNLEAISQIAFSETFEVSSASLSAQLESLCIRELQWHVNVATELVLGVAADLQHRSTVSVGEVVEASGFVIGIGDREATFTVEARTGGHEVAAGTIRFVVVERDQFPRRAATGARATSALLLRAQRHTDAVHSGHAGAVATLN